MKRNFLFRYKYHFIVLFLLILGYQLLFSPGFIEARIKGYIQSNTSAQIDLEVKRSSLIYGFEFENVNLRTLDNVPIFEARRIRLSWFLPSMLAGHIGVREVGLYDASLHLLKKDGNWNYDSLRKAKQVSSESQPGETRESSELPEEINVYLPLKVYGSINIENFSFYYEKNDNIDRSVNQKFSLEELDTRVAFITDTFTSIPINQSAIDLFDTLVIAVNPFRPVKVHYDGSGILDGPVQVGLRLFRRVDGDGIIFSSRLDLDSSLLTYKKPGYYIPPPAIKLSYETVYQHSADVLDFNRFHLSYGKETWVKFSGNIQRILNGPQELDLKITESNINLNPPGQLISALTANEIRFGGNASLFPLTVQGSPDNMYFEGKLSGRNLFFATTTNHSVPILDFRIAGRVNLYESTEFLHPPPYYSLDAPLAFNLIKELKIDELNAIYNGSTLNGKASILPDAGIDANVQLTNFNLGSLLAPAVTGFGSANLVAKSDIDFEEVDIQGNVNVQGGRYSIGRSRSGINNLNLNADVLLKLKDGLALDIKSIALNGRNAAGGPFLKLTGSSYMDFNDGQMYRLNINNLDVSYNDAYQTLPGVIRSQIQPFRVYLRQGFKLSTNSTIKTQAGSLTVNGQTSVTLPSLGNEPIQITKNMAFSENQLSFPVVQIAGLRGALSANLSGRLYKTDKWHPDLRLDLSIARDQMLPVHENLSLRGSLKLNAVVNAKQATGGLYIENLGIQFYSGDCSVVDQPACYRMAIEGLNLNLPIVHDMNMVNPARVGTVSLRQTGDGFKAAPNLSLKYVRASHRPGGNFAPDGFYFVGAVPGNLPHGLSGRVDYRRNVLTIDWLEAYAAAPVRKSDSLTWEPRGRITGRQIFFNAADLEPANMEFGAYLQAHNLDLEPYFGTGEASYDGVISADLRAYGLDLRDLLRNTNARVAVHRISDDFTGFAVRLAMPNPIIASSVNNVLEIPSLSAELRGGLVYTSIQVKSPSPFSLARVIRPSEEEIKQERIPLAQFLERARSEAEVFQSGIEK